MGDSSNDPVKKKQTGHLAAASLLPADPGLAGEILACLGEGVVAVDSGWHFLYVNPACAEMLNCSPDELLGKTPFDLIVPEDFPKVSQLFLESGGIKPVYLETRVQRADGKVLHISVKGIPRKLAGGAIAGIGLVQNISNRKQAEVDLFQARSEMEMRVKERTQALEKLNSLLRVSEARYRAVVEDQSDLICRWLPDGRFTFANQAYCRYFDLSYDEIIGREFVLMIPVEDQGILQDALKKVNAQNPVVTYEHRVILKSGEVRWQQWTDRAIFDAQGQTIEFQSVGRDITSLKKAEENLRAEIRSARALAQSAERLNANLDLQQVLHTVCEEVARLLAVSAASVLLYDERVDTYYHVVTYGMPSEESFFIDGIPSEMIDRLLSDYGWVASIPNLQLLDGIPHLAPYLRFGFRSAALAALKRDDDVLGVLSVATRGGTRVFTDSDLEMLKAFSMLAVLAIANARLFGEVTAWKERLAELSRQLVMAQEAERRAVARELHDEIGQTLTSLKLLLETRSAHAGEASVSAPPALSLVQQLIDRVRDLSLNLRPSMLDDLGLLPTLISHFERYTSQTEILVDFRHTGIEQRFQSELETTAYRIVQEALTNVARHAQVKQVAVRLWCTPDRMHIQVDDQGLGFDPVAAATSARTGGVSGMQERAELIGGKVIIESEIGRGTRLMAELPINGNISIPQKNRLQKSPPLFGDGALSGRLEQKRL